MPRTFRILLLLLLYCLFWQPVASFAQDKEVISPKPYALEEQLRLAWQQYQRGEVFETIDFTVVTPDGPFPVSLKPHSIFSERYRSVVVTASGEQQTTETIATFRAAELDESHEFYTRFTLSVDESGESTIIGYLRRDGIDYSVVEHEDYPGSFVVDALTEEASQRLLATCGVLEEEHRIGPRRATTRSTTRRNTKLIELATEADYEYHQDYGSASAANTNIASIVNAIDAIFSTELNLRIEIVYQRTWAISSDPYSSTLDGETLLNEFRTYWNSNMSSSVTYDISHLWTGKDMNGSAIGLAWVGATCSSYRYGWSQDYGNFNQKVVLTAHELGHNLGASHDSSCDGTNIMCSYVQSTADKFSTTSKNAIEADIPFSGCLSDYESTTVTLSINNTSINENGSATVTATLNQTAASNVTVTLATSGTATSGVDYNLSSSTITINAGSLSGTATISAINDTLDENNETVIVDISSVTNATENGTQQVTTTIIDNDAAPSVSLSANKTSISEGGESVTITATLSAVSGKNVTVYFDYSGTAGGSDYSGTTASITINAGSSSGSFNLSSSQDTIDENNETIIVDIDSVTNGTIGSPSSRTVTINDDDAAPSVTLSRGSASVNEGLNTTLTATLSNASAFTVTVQLGFSGVAGGSDYSVPTQIQVPAGQLSASVTFVALDDAIDESDEGVTISIDSVTNGTEAGTQVETITIVDTDPTPTVTLSAAPTTVSENGGVSTITATMSNASDKTVTVSLSYAGTAVGSGTDYTASATSIDIFAGNTSGSVTITGVNDSRDELNETVIVDIISVSNAVESGTQQVTVTLSDDDPAPTVTLSASPTTIAENGGTSTITATLSAVSNLDVQVQLGVSGTAGGFDYSITSTTITIPAGSSSQSVTVQGANDLLDESDETLIFDITSVTNGTESGTQQVTVTITDDDTGAVITVANKQTADNRPSLNGTIDDTSATVQIAVNGQSYAASNNGDGTWTLADNAITPALADGVYEVLAVATTAGGVISQDSSSDELTIDTTAPSIAVNALSTQDSTPALNGTVNDATATISVSVNGTLYSATNNGDGTWILADNSISPALAEGTYSVLAQAQDAVGNIGTDPTANELVIDRTAPVITVNTLSTSLRSPALSGSVNESGASISVTVNGGTYAAMNNGDGSWTLAAGTIATLPLGTFNVAATATDAAGNSGSDATSDELEVFDGDADMDGVNDSVDNCVNDVNPDQADDDGDGIGNVCDASHALPSSPAFVKWNTFLKQWNFLELVVQGSVGLNATVSLYNLRGEFMISTNAAIAASGETDVDINGLVRAACLNNPASCAGFTDLDADGLIDTYGLARVDFDDSNPNAILIGRLSNYRPDPVHLAAIGGSFSFALTRELRPPLKGTSHAVANTFDAQNLGYLVPNWAELTLLGNLSGTDSLGFTINLYRQDGTLASSEYLVLNGLQERDTAAGHQLLDPGSGSVVQAVYLVEVIPDDPNVPYLFSVTRYSSNAPPGYEPETYNYSVTAPGRKGADGTLFASINRESYSCGSVTNWVEIANTLAQSVQLTAVFRDSSGATVGTANESVAPKAQNHYNASALLLEGDIGSVEISSSVAGALIATSMVYIFECDRPGIQTGYAAMARELGRKDQVGSVNTFLGISDTLRILSTSTGSQNISIALRTYLNETSGASVSLDAKATLDEFLSSGGVYVLPADRYGTVTLGGPAAQGYLAEVLRKRFKSQGGQTRLDFVIPTQIN